MSGSSIRKMTLERIWNSNFNFFWNTVILLVFVKYSVCWTMEEKTIVNVPFSKEGNRSEDEVSFV